MSMHNLRVIRRHSKVLAKRVVAVGNFDGVHQGHQALLEQLHSLAKDHQALKTVVLFYPHPRAFFQPDQAPRQLMSLAEKLRMLKAYGVDQVAVIRFDAKMAALSAEAFIETILVAQLNTKAVVVGEDFRFGQKRQGDIRLLQTTGPHKGFETHVAKAVCHDQKRVSSTWLREAFVNGDIALIETLTGRLVRVSGPVISGAQQGRKWGVPTANIALRHNPGLHGVFIGTVELDGRDHPAVLSIGHRPVVGGGERLLEAHLLNYDGLLYGRILQVTIQEKIRDQRYFAETSSLIEAMHEDIAIAKTYHQIKGD